ncbi:MAG TPA: hypothetical protein VGH38_14130 [Bryobacteraceae bacterium]
MDVESLACPVSVITPESQRVLDQFYQARRVNKASGAVLLGADSSLWPARWYDAVALLQGEIEREEAAAQRAIHSRPAA